MRASHHIQAVKATCYSSAEETCLAVRAVPAGPYDKQRPLGSNRCLGIAQVVSRSLWSASQSPQSPQLIMSDGKMIGSWTGIDSCTQDLSISASGCVRACRDRAMGASCCSCLQALKSLLEAKLLPSCLYPAICPDVTGPQDPSPPDQACCSFTNKLLQLYQGPSAKQQLKVAHEAACFCTPQI